MKMGRHSFLWKDEDHWGGWRANEMIEWSRCDWPEVTATEWKTKWGRRVLDVSRTVKDSLDGHLSADRPFSPLFFIFRVRVFTICGFFFAPLQDTLVPHWTRDAEQVAENKQSDLVHLKHLVKQAAVCSRRMEKLSSKRLNVSIRSDDLWVVCFQLHMVLMRLRLN